MASVKDTFNAAISEAIKNADLITDNYQKAMALANIAQALAATGLINDVAEETKETKKKTKSKKTADELKRQPKELPAEEEPAEQEEAEEAKEEAQGEFTDEWTEEALETFADELQYITDFVEKWGEEGANSCLADFSEGVLTDITADVNPLNIKGIVAAFQKLEEDAESASE
jgi:hypothetical protein